MARPDDLDPPLVIRRPLGLGASRERRREDLAQGMHEVEDRREGREMPTPDRPVHREAVPIDAAPEGATFTSRLSHRSPSGM